MNVNANDKTIEAVLASGFFEVPRFQRPYSWDASNVEDFWEDIAEAELDYFIGAMVIFTDAEPAGLVDGQQRLTTITMLLAAIRNEFIRVGAGEEADGVQTLIERKDSRGKRRFVLQTESSYPYLQAQIQSFPGKAAPADAARAEEKALEEAFSILSASVRSIATSVEQNDALSQAQKQAKLRQQLEQLRDKVFGLTVVLVEVNNEDDATTIFQTLNTRGKDLETADLVKAHLLQMLKVSNEGLDQARDTWDGMRQSFDESAANISMNGFLLHSWLSRNEYTGAKDLFRLIKKGVRSNNAQDYLDELRDDADRYRTAWEPGFRTWKKPQHQLASSLHALNLFRMRQPLPFVLSVLREYDRETIRLGVAVRALRGVECFHFAATAVTNQPSSGGISKMYALAARRVLNGKGSAQKAAAIDELLDKLRQRRPTYPEFEAAFVELRSSRVHTQQTTLVRYVLASLHVAAARTSGVPPDVDVLTLEHLVPQGAKRPATVDIGDVARLGNLLLVSEGLNQELGDKSFGEKRKILAGVDGVEEAIVAAKSWGAAEILDRSKRLARSAYEDVWAF